MGEINILGERRVPLCSILIITHSSLQKGKDCMSGLILNCQGVDIASH